MTTRQIIDLATAGGSVVLALGLNFLIRVLFRRGKALEDA